RRGFLRPHCPPGSTGLQRCRDGLGAGPLLRANLRCKIPRAASSKSKAALPNTRFEARVAFFVRGRAAATSSDEGSREPLRALSVDKFVSKLGHDLHTYWSRRTT